MYRTLRHSVKMNMALEIFRNDVLLEQSVQINDWPFELTFSFEISILLFTPLIQKMLQNIKCLRSRFGKGEISFWTPFTKKGLS